ncbi:glycosyltransferase family 9 protein [Luteibaculum oceani]|uniref:Glycosyltransferase family 9 protein n=1 Tax=Luteibaculum oceani TaxID=1294296 RepID=A0A5C6UVH1_9FLAO|nr:glycosyltransferase family 9 protein [Luteibaculum oceani]TXC76969.1 glycosyltransferase family 9 protein [Luteibaculum oceani]
MDKILIVQTAFIGDAILASSLVQTVLRNRKDVELHLLVRKGNEGLFKNHPNIKKVWIWDKAKKYKSLFGLIPTIRKAKFDWIFCVQRFGTMGLLTTLSGAKKKVGFRKNPWALFFDFKIDHQIGDGTHEISRNAMLLTPWLGTQPTAEPPHLVIGEKELNKVRTYADEKEFICLFPASVWFTKQLPFEKWLELIAKHPDQKIYIMGAPGDKLLGDNLISQTQHKNIENLCGKLNLLESAALMTKARMNYVNDSAPLHLASATQSKVTAFFCSTIPQFGFGPTQPDAKIIETKTELKCRPCGLHGKKSCPEGHFKCGREIEVPTLKS